MPTFFNTNNRKGVFMIPAGATKSPTPAPPSFSNTKSLSFDGIDEYIDLSSSINLGTNSTISFWFKSSVGNTNHTLIGEHTYSFDYLLQLASGTNTSFVRIGSVVKSFTTTELNDGNWNHWCIVRSGGSVELFINNVSKGTQTGYGTGTNTLFNVIGAEGDFQFPINGFLDEFAGWNTALTSDNVNDIYNGGTPNDLTSLSPVLWYRMGDNSTYQTPQILMPENTNKDKVSNYSLAFDGVDDFVSIYDGTSGSGPIQFTASDDFSISAWVKTSSLSSTNYILSFRGTSLIWFNTLATSGNIRARLYLRDNSSNVVTISTFNNSTGWITADTWTNVVVTRNGTTKELNIYLNGTQAQTTTTDTTTDDFTLYDKLSIGNDNFGGGRYWYEGQIDEVAIFDSVVDVASIYNSGTPTTITGAIAYWRMGEEATFVYNVNPDGTWTIPDQVGSNDGTSNNQMVDSARLGDAPNSENNAVSFNMEAADISNDTP